MFHFVTSCVSALSEDISEMIDLTEVNEKNESVVNFNDMKKILGPALEDFVEMMGCDLDFLENDHAVSYEQSHYQGIPCYYIKHSAIEHVYIHSNDMDKVLNYDEAQERQCLMSEFEDRLDEVWDVLKHIKASQNLTMSFEEMITNSSMPSKYQEFQTEMISHMNYNHGLDNDDDEGRDDFIDWEEDIRFIFNKGGIIERVMFLDDLNEIRIDNLAGNTSWTTMSLNENSLIDYLRENNKGTGGRGEGTYLLKAITQPGNIHLGLINLPEEHKEKEVNINDINKLTDISIYKQNENKKFDYIGYLDPKEKKIKTLPLPSSSKEQKKLDQFWFEKPAQMNKIIKLIIELDDELGGKIDGARIPELKLYMGYKDLTPLIKYIWENVGRDEFIEHNDLLFDQQFRRSREWATNLQGDKELTLAQKKSIHDEVVNNIDLVSFVMDAKIINQLNLSDNKVDWITKSFTSLDNITPEEDLSFDK